MEENMDKEIQLLNRLYQDANIGMQSIDKVLKKIENEELKKIFKNQFEAYQKIADRCDIIALNRNDEVKDSGMFKKIKQTAMIYISLWMDKSSRHIVEMMINGTVMGIVDTIKAEKDLKPKSDDIKSLILDYKKLQNEFYEKLKKLLSKV